jgi:hypothetical protein
MPKSLLLYSPKHNATSATADIISAVATLVGEHLHYLCDVVCQLKLQRLCAEPSISRVDD